MRWYVEDESWLPEESAQWLESWKFSPTSWLLEGRRAADSVNPRVVESVKILVRGRELPVWWTNPRAGRMVHLKLHELEASALEMLPDLTLCTSSSGCSPVSSIKSFITNQYMLGKCFPESSEPLQQISELRLVSWEPLTWIQVGWSVGNPGTHYLQLSSEVGAVFWDRALNLSGLH